MRREVRPRARQKSDKFTEMLKVQYEEGNQCKLMTTCAFHCEGRRAFI